MTLLLTFQMMNYSLEIVQLPYLEEFYKGVIEFYQRFIQKQLQKLDFKSRLLHILSFLDPANSLGIKQCTFDQIEDILPISFDKSAIKLEHENLWLILLLSILRVMLLSFGSMCTV
jgi:hypothetical protein